MNKTNFKGFKRRLAAGIMEICQVDEMEAYRIIKRGGPEYFKENAAKFNSETINYWVLKMLVKVSDDPRYSAFLDRWQAYSPFETLMGYTDPGIQSRSKAKVKTKRQGRST